MFLELAYARIILMDSILATGAYVSSKSIPSTWAYPLHNSLALFLVTSASSFSLFLKTHFLPITFLSLGRGTSSQVLFFSIWLISSSIALVQPFSPLAWSKLFGSILDSRDTWPCSGDWNCFLLLVSTPASLSPIIFSAGWLFWTYVVGVLWDDWTASVGIWIQVEGDWRHALDGVWMLIDGDLGTGSNSSYVEYSSSNCNSISAGSSCASTLFLVFFSSWGLLSTLTFTLSTILLSLRL